MELESSQFDLPLTSLAPDLETARAEEVLSGASGPLSRRDLLKNAALLGAVVLASERGASPTVPQVTRHTVPMPRLQERVRVVQLSDLHRSWCVADWFIGRAVDLANAEEPDIVALTGDFVTRQASYALSCAEQLKRLKPRLGSFAVPGNHDYWADNGTGMPLISEMLAGANIPMLVNKTLKFDSGLWLVGLDDVWTGAPNPDLLKTIPLGEPILTLTHNPNLFNFLDRYESTVLCGHTHGGQINLPYVSGKILGKLSYLKGWYAGKVPASRLYVSRGLGTVKIPIRVNARPEIAVFDFVPG